LQQVEKGGGGGRLGVPRKITKITRGGQGGGTRGRLEKEDLPRNGEKQRKRTKKKSGFVAVLGSRLRSSKGLGEDEKN